MLDLPIRPATVEDEPAIRRVLEHSYPVLLPSHYDVDILSEALPHMTEPNPQLLRSGRYYLAQLDGSAVACGGWSLEPLPDVAIPSDHALIRRFAVIATMVGRGLGRRLFQTCEAAAREQGIRGMLVRSSLNAEPFYASLGFRPLRPIDMPLPSGRGLPCVLMERPL